MMLNNLKKIMEKTKNKKINIHTIIKMKEKEIKIKKDMSVVQIKARIVKEVVKRSKNKIKISTILKN